MDFEPPTKKVKRGVTFSTQARVILIPHLNDYKVAGLCESLWYDQNELDKARLCAVQMKNNHNCCSPSPAHDEVKETDKSLIENFGGSVDQCVLSH